MAPARIPFDACPLCAGEEGDLLLEADGSRHALYKAGLPPTLRWVRCTRCRHVFTDSYFNDEALALLFSGALEWQLPGSRLDVGRQVSARIVERAALTRGSFSGRWLDVGFGNGALVTTAAEFGFDAVGLDVREEPVRRLREFGFEAHCAALADFTTDRPFDVISLADVLEHMPFPRAALIQVRQLLNPGGLLFVSLPNLDCFNWQALDREGKNPYWAELEHIHNFGRVRLQALLREVGFEPVSYAVSERYVLGMEILARKVAEP